MAQHLASFGRHKSNLELLKLDTEHTKEKSHKSLWLIALQVRPEGFEPPTLGSEDRCAIQLRHGRKSFNVMMLQYHRKCFQTSEIVLLGILTEQ